VSRALQLARAFAALVLVASAFSACGGLGSTPGPSAIPSQTLPLREGRYVVSFLGPLDSAGCRALDGVSPAVVVHVRLRPSGTHWVAEIVAPSEGDLSLRFGPGPLDGSFLSRSDGIGIAGQASGTATDTLLARAGNPLGGTTVSLGTASAPATLRGGMLRLPAAVGASLGEGVVDGAVVFRNMHGDASSCPSGTVRWSFASSL
jgi:hypothetical protein